MKRISQGRTDSSSRRSLRQSRSSPPRRGSSPAWSPWTPWTPAGRTSLLSWVRLLGTCCFLVIMTLYNLFVCLSPTFRHWIPQCCNSRSQCLVHLPPCRYWGLSQGRWPVSKITWSGIFQFVFPFEPFPVARRQNYCKLEEMRTVLRTTREPPIKLRRFDLQYLTPTIKQVQLCPMTKRQKYKKWLFFFFKM